MVRCIHCSLEVPLTDLREHHAALNCSVAVPGSSTTSVPQAGSQVSGAHNNSLAVPAGPSITSVTQTKSQVSGAHNSSMAVPAGLSINTVPQAQSQVSGDQGWI